MKVLIPRIFAFAVALALLTSAGTAAQGRSAWSEADYSRVRLLLSPADGEAIDGGVEIQLEPGWHTYWRVPGDAGVPPQFDFSGSRNVAGIEVHYPVPERYDDGQSVSVVYTDRVVFPLTIHPEDPAKPVDISLGLFYGACAEVCIPVKAEANASLAPGRKSDPLARVAIAEFKTRLPQAQSDDFRITSVKRDGDALTIKANVPESGAADLFAEGPADWFIGQPEVGARGRGTASFRLSLEGIPEGSELDGALDFLLVSGRRGVLAEDVVIDKK
jgi:DsbC/DsbD-like thiol-disulfide interchange protein